MPSWEKFPTSPGIWVSEDLRNNWEVVLLDEVLMFKIGSKPYPVESNRLHWFYGPIPQRKSKFINPEDNPLNKLKGIFDDVSEDDWAQAMEQL